MFLGNLRVNPKRNVSRAESRAQSTLHTWQMRDFLLITQVDAQNIEDCFEILQVRIPRKKR